MAPLQEHIALLEKALTDVLAIIDGPEMQAQESWALVHGYRCPEEPSKRNQATIESAYKLLKRERP